MNNTTLTNISLTGRVGSINRIAGKDMLFLSLAVNRTYLRGSERVKETDWHDVVFYGKLADVIEKYVKVSDKIIIHGVLEDWGDNKVVIRASHFDFDTGSFLNLVGFLEKKELNSYLSLSISVNRKIKVDDNKNDLKKDIYSVRVYDKELAEIINRELPVGSRISVIGELYSYKVENSDKKDVFVRARKINII